MNFTLEFLGLKKSKRNLAVFLAITLTFSVAFSYSGGSPGAYKKLNAINSASLSEYKKETHLKLFMNDKKARLRKNFRVGGSWLTLAHDIVTSGPILERKIEESKVNYVKKVFGYLIYKADLLARSDSYRRCENEDKVDAGLEECKDPKNWTYYSFLVLALSVPHHESFLNHFLKKNPSRDSSEGNKVKNCSDEINSLSPKAFALKKSSKYKMGKMNSRTKEILLNRYKRDEEILLPDCKYFSKNETTTQVFASKGLRDFGIMQMNAFYHPSALDPFSYLNIYRSIDRGIEYLYFGDRGKSGFSYISKNYRTRYKSCNFQDNPFRRHKLSKSRPYYSLIRSSWDKYNKGGNTVKTVCRFILNPKSKYVTGFKKSLDRVVLSNSSLYHNYLPKDSDEYKALNEIIYNFRSIFSKRRNQERNHYINKVLTKTFQPISNHYVRPRKEIHLNFTIKRKDVPIYSQVNNKEVYMCGVLKKGARVELMKNSDGKDIKIFTKTKNSISQEIREDLWGVIRGPKYSDYVDLRSSQRTIVKLKKGKRKANIRREPVVVKDCKNCVGYFSNKEIGAKELLYLGERGKWINIEYNKKSAWVASFLVSLERVDFEDKENKKGCAEKSAANIFYINMRDVSYFDGKISDIQFKKGEFAIVKVNGSDAGVANLRATPSGLGNLVRVAKKGESFQVIDFFRRSSGSIWLKLRSGSWVWSPAVDIIHVEEK